MTKIAKFTHILITILVLFYQDSFAQETKSYSVSGVLKDFANHAPIEFASVAIYKIPDTVLITGTITNAKGEFVLTNLPPCSYLIKSSFVGYQTDLHTVEITHTSVNLATPLYLSAASLSLNEVQVTASQNEKQVSIEKTKINIAQSISAVSGSITEVLKNQASVSIDAENTLYLRGNKNILLLIDGVPTTLSALNSIPSSNVGSIEIMTNPDAKYDAEGTGGIINIVTKRQNLAGMSGVASINFGILDRLNGGVSINYMKSIWDFGVNYSGRYEVAEIRSNLWRELFAQHVLVYQDIVSAQTNSTHSFAFVVNAKPTKKDIYSIGFKYVTPKLNNVQSITGQQFADTIPAISFHRKNDITFSRKTIESTLSYKKIMEKNKHELSFEASFSRTKGSRPAQYYIENVLLQKSHGGGAPTNMVFQADYLKSLFKTGKMEFGLKGFSRWNNFNYYFYDLDTVLNQWNLNPSFSNDLEHQEFIYSSYLMYSDSLFRKAYFKIGARIEYNTTELLQKSINERVCRDYLFPFPYLMINYTINKSQSIAFALNRRITRPTYPQLNPFINVIDQMTYETGNKILEPETIDKIELNYTLLNEGFQIRSNVFYSRTTNFITQVSTLLVPDKLLLTYVNGVKQLKLGCDFDIAYSINKNMTINPAFSLFSTTSTGQYNEIDLSTNSFAWTGNIKAVVKPMKRTEMQLFLSYNAPIELPQFTLSEIYYADIAVKRSFFDNRLSASLTLTDVFDTRNWQIDSYNAIYSLKNHSKSETRMLWIGLTYTLSTFKAGKSPKGAGDDNEGGIIKLGQ